MIDILQETTMLCGNMAGYREADLRLSCSMNSDDYVDVFLDAATITFKAHYGSLEPSHRPDQYVVTFNARKIADAIAFIMDNNRFRISMRSAGYRLDLTHLDHKYLLVEIREYDQSSSRFDKHIMIGPTRTEVFLGALRTWLCNTAEGSTMPTFGLA